MDIKKFAPWNWFKKEEEEAGARVPVVQKTDTQPVYTEGGVLNPIVQLHREVDRIFEDAFRGSGIAPFKTDIFPSMTAAGLLKPQVDIGATEKEYSITVEVPGVDEKDVKVEITNNTMTIRGEKKQEKEEKDKNYYRVERSYGSFQRVLSLPEDADQENVKATFKKGVLTIKMPKKQLPKPDVKQIEIKSS
ncbi:MAG: Hsp20/alpha crystallin family protein [Desulfobulbaceae bacterium]|nr:Hsp20/alpha crystallin family protein [Desulfobulbaceae bacterium]